MEKDIDLRFIEWVAENHFFLYAVGKDEHIWRSESFDYKDYATKELKELYLDAKAKTKRK